jgi:hypothetical protein
MFVYPDPLNHPVVTDWYWETVLCTQIFSGANPPLTIFAQAASQAVLYRRYRVPPLGRPEDEVPTVMAVLTQPVAFGSFPVQLFSKHPDAAGAGAAPARIMPLASASPLTAAANLMGTRELPARLGKNLAICIVSLLTRMRIALSGLRADFA